MKLALLTNMPSYHQAQLGEHLTRLLGVDNFRLVFVEPTSDARIEMGWADEFSAQTIIRFWQGEKAREDARDWIEKADVVIQGRVPMSMVRYRIKSGKLTFAYQERFWKRPLTPLRFIMRLPRIWRRYWSVNKHNYHLLAAGAYVAPDIAKISCFKGRAWKFGYFIEPVLPSELYREPKHEAESGGVLRLLWCARFSTVKQAHHAIQIMRGLVTQGVDCHLTMVGDGEERAAIEASALEIRENVDFVGWRSSEEVGKLMQQSHVFLMTSGFGEGWALVINEAIARGCMAVANQLVGAAPWLIKNHETGLLYDQAKLGDVINSLAGLRHDQILKMGTNARALHDAQWSAAVAAERVVELSRALLANDGSAENLYISGPCSAAPALVAID